MIQKKRRDLILKEDMPSRARSCYEIACSNSYFQKISTHYLNLFHSNVRILLSGIHLYKQM